MEVRRTKRMGGHLPSAAKSNTMPGAVPELPQRRPGHRVLGRGSPRRGAHRRRAGSAPAHDRAGRPGPPARRTGRGPGRADLPRTRPAGRGRAGHWLDGCADHSHHPATGKPCEVTFLDCFHCGNCLVTRDHLPGLLGLLDALGQRRRELAGKHGGTATAPPGSPSARTFSPSSPRPNWSMPRHASRATRSLT